MLKYCHKLPKKKTKSKKINNQSTVKINSKIHFDYEFHIELQFKNELKTLQMALQNADNLKNVIEKNGQ